MTRVTRLSGAFVLVVALALPAACVRLPESGPVVDAGSTSDEATEPGMDYNPPPPKEGGSATDIVRGFLNAMTATPIQQKPAREFLTTDAQAAWDPGLETITYPGTLTPRGESQVSVTLTDADHLDSRGAWQGALPTEDQNLTFPMKRDENGEWRIDEAPNALIVPETWYENHFRQVSLYFFDPTSTVLVPEPVFVPNGEQLASTLVAGLLRGPGPGLSLVSHSLLPAEPVELSVPFSGGVASIKLTGAADQPAPQDIPLMLAQVAWTLRQEPTIQSFRLTIGDVPVQLPGAVTEFSVDEGADYDPTGLRSSSLFYGLRDGLLVSGSPESQTPVDGPLGRDDYNLRSIGVNLDATKVGGVAADGRSVLMAPVRDPEDKVTQVVSHAANLLDPAWDLHDRMWLVDRSPTGARISYVQNGKVRSLDVPRLTGRDVKRFLVSRDGSRLVAVVHRGDRGDEFLVSRIRYDINGRVLDALPATRVFWEGGKSLLQVRDIGWLTPTTFAVLHRVAQSYEVRSLTVDGAPSGLDGLPTKLNGDFRALAGSPVPGEDLYAVTRSGLADVTDPGAGNPTLDPGITMIGYVG
ncbi:LpqB family beta-propeller domain-containing protein [Nocardioides sp.]|uniref:LpqB family beta-propeller domain-containing protein n=1 Tax=Nocardioides sp. TaxID=35761 RepID=UPI0031FE5412|nr:hypothetical protein [Nocardioides sp.]